MRFEHFNVPRQRPTEEEKQYLIDSNLIPNNEHIVDQLSKLVKCLNNCTSFVTPRQRMGEKDLEELSKLDMNLSIDFFSNKRAFHFTKYEKPHVNIPDCFLYDFEAQFFNFISFNQIHIGESIQEPLINDNEIDSICQCIDLNFDSLRITSTKALNSLGSKEAPEKVIKDMPIDIPLTEMFASCIISYKAKPITTMTNIVLPEVDTPITFKNPKLSLNELKSKKSSLLNFTSPPKSGADVFISEEYKESLIPSLFAGIDTSPLNNLSFTSLQRTYQTREKLDKMKDVIESAVLNFFDDNVKNEVDNEISGFVQNADFINEIDVLNREFNFEIRDIVSLAITDTINNICINDFRKKPISPIFAYKFEPFFDTAIETVSANAALETFDLLIQDKEEYSGIEEEDAGIIIFSEKLDEIYNEELSKSIHSSGDDLLIDSKLSVELEISDVESQPVNTSGKIGSSFIDDAIGDLFENISYVISDNEASFKSADTSSIDFYFSDDLANDPIEEHQLDPVETFIETNFNEAFIRLAAIEVKKALNFEVDAIFDEEQEVSEQTEIEISEFKDSSDTNSSICSLFPNSDLYMPIIDTLVDDVLSSALEHVDEAIEDVETKKLITFIDSCFTEAISRTAQSQVFNTINNFRVKDPDEKRVTFITTLV